MISKLASIGTDHATTALGMVAGGEKLSEVDWNKLMQGDYAEIGKAVVGLVFALWGLLTNR